MVGVMGERAAADSEVRPEAKLLEACFCRLERVDAMAWLMGRSLLCVGEILRPGWRLYAVGLRGWDWLLSDVVAVDGAGEPAGIAGVSSGVLAARLQV